MAAVARRAAEGVCRAHLVVEDMHRCAEASQTGVSLRYMMEFGARATSPRNLVRSAEFLRRELPLRLARRVLELDSMPFGLSSMPPVVKVRDWYFDSFRELRFFPQIKDMEDELAFTQLLKMVKMRHNNVVPALATGLNQLKNGMPSKVGDGELEEIHRFLDRFYMSRIGICMLAGQHVALHDADKEPGCVGLINSRMSPVLVAQHASEDARTVCLRKYGSAPDVNIYGNPDFTFPYVPSHLYLMMFELVKNSLRAVQERYMNSDKEPPPVRIIVAEGIEDVAIKICDEGGGIPRSVLPKIFTYSYTTAEKLIDDNYIYSARYNGITMAGYGYGLPLSRLYARYFGGDLQVISMEGYGTDAYLHLCRLGDSKEPLS